MNKDLLILFVIAETLYFVGFAAVMYYSTENQNSSKTLMGLATFIIACGILIGIALIAKIRITKKWRKK